MGNPLGNDNSFVGGEGFAIVSSIEQVNPGMRQSLRTFIENDIAMPDLAVVNMDADYEPVVLGEDGEELTLERRRQIMAGKRAMIDEKGNVVDQDYRAQFDSDLETERLGKSSEANRPGMRIVNKRLLTAKDVERMQKGERREPKGKTIMPDRFIE